MIRETLGALRTGNQTPEDLAQRLGIGREELKRRLELLENGGYISKVSEPPACGPRACPGCSGSRSGGCCPSSGGAKGMAFVLTEKGARALGRDGQTGP
jgi:hypothetical protein